MIRWVTYHNYSIWLFQYLSHFFCLLPKMQNAKQINNWTGQKRTWIRTEMSVTKRHCSQMFHLIYVVICICVFFYQAIWICFFFCICLHPKKGTIFLFLISPEDELVFVKNSLNLSCGNAHQLILYGWHQHNFESHCDTTVSSKTHPFYSRSARQIFQAINFN